MHKRIAERVIVDSDLTLEEVLRQKQEILAPHEILERQRLVQVRYYSFDGKLHKGQIIVDVDLVADVKEAFDLIRKTKFPIKSVIPFVDRRLMSKDESVASLNNSSAFNYRTIANTNKLSNHALGRAFDINPALNPFMKGEEVLPLAAKYETKVSGTIIGKEEFVTYLKARGWVWGGDWTDRKDYMHFEKP